MSDADVELARTKARRRMIGMAVLVLAGVVGFPWLFETQPRPLTGEVQVLSAAGNVPAVVVPPLAVVPKAPISGRVQTAPDVSPTAVAERAEAVEVIDEPSLAAAPSPAQSPTPAVAVAPKPVDQAASKAAAARALAQVKAKQEAKLEAKARQEAKAKAEQKAHDDKDHAEAKAKGAKPEEKANTRYIVQVGAFSDQNTAQAARLKVEKLGIKTYAQEVSTPTGKKIRVRVGPYANKAEADKAMATLRKAGMVAAILTL